MLIRWWRCSQWYSTLSWCGTTCTLMIMIHVVSSWGRLRVVRLASKLISGVCCWTLTANLKQTTSLYTHLGHGTKQGRRREKVRGKMYILYKEEKMMESKNRRNRKVRERGKYELQKERRLCRLCGRRRIWFHERNDGGLSGPWHLNESRTDGEKYVWFFVILKRDRMRGKMWKKVSHIKWIFEHF